MALKQIFLTWKKVFTNWKYLTTTFIVTLVFYSLNVLISNLGNLKNFYSSLGFFQMIRFFIILFFGFKETIMLYSFVSLIVNGLLFGLLFSLVSYKVNIGKGVGGKKIGLFGSAGLFLAAFIPGCAFCGIGLAYTLGISAGVLSFLPYEGFEFTLASIGILVFTILYVTKNMNKCKLNNRRILTFK